jgi:hypothetical protein
MYCSFADRHCTLISVISQRRTEKVITKKHFIVTGRRLSGKQLIRRDSKFLVTSYCIFQDLMNEITQERSEPQQRPQLMLKQS